MSFLLDVFSCQSAQEIVRYPKSRVCRDLTWRLSIRLRPRRLGCRLLPAVRAGSSPAWDPRPHGILVRAGPRSRGLSPLPRPAAPCRDARTPPAAQKRRAPRAHQRRNSEVKASTELAPIYQRESCALFRRRCDNFATLNNVLRTFGIVSTGIIGGICPLAFVGRVVSDRRPRVTEVRALTIRMEELEESYEKLWFK